MITFNADEIYAMAEQIERNGAKYYRTAARRAEGDPHDLLIRLAEMEDDHLKTFGQMRAELAGRETQPTVADPDDEAALYLQAMADGKVFDADPSEKLTGDESMQDILNTAVDLEKDSIVFYQSMKTVVPKRAGLERLEDIIMQEIGHIRLLTAQLGALSS
jgi:rubrerythrin